MGYQPKTLCGHIFWGLFWLLLVCSTSARAVAQDSASYRLNQGDTVAISHSGLDEPVQATVDMDGHVRLVDFGPIRLEGLDLAAAEQAIAAAIEAAGFFVEPRVDMALVDFAPIVVAGDVMQPGRLTYSPNLTVEAAVAIAGGLRLRGREQSDVLYLQADLRGQLRQKRLDIATQKVIIARVKAALAQADTLGLSDQTQSNLEQAGAVSDFVANSQKMLDADLARLRRLLEHWDQEIGGLDNQRQIYQDRIAVREEIAVVAQSELDIAKSLQAKGLQTSARMLAVELSEANARSNVLELQTAQVVAATARAEAQRERDMFLTTRELRLHEELMRAQDILAKAEIDAARLKDQLAQLMRVDFDDDGTLRSIEIGFRLNRAGNPVPDVVVATPVLPGDTLFVHIQHAIPE